MESQQSRRIVTALAHRVETGADARQVADALVSTWQEIDAALSPVLGRHAVALLYQRSACQAAKTHPWLAGVCEDRKALPTEALRSAFEQQGSAAATAAGYELLRAFLGMLASLVGLPLAERLLRFVYSADGPAAAGSARSARVESPRRELAS